MSPMTNNILQKVSTVAGKWLDTDNNTAQAAEMLL